jgi:hypothetical protein
MLILGLADLPLTILGNNDSTVLSSMLLPLLDNSYALLYRSTLLLKSLFRSTFTSELFPLPSPFVSNDTSLTARPPTDCKFTLELKSLWVWSLLLPSITLPRLEFVCGRVRKKDELQLGMLPTSSDPALCTGNNPRETLREPSFVLFPRSDRSR